MGSWRPLCPTFPSFPKLVRRTSMTTSSTSKTPLPVGVWPRYLSGVCLGSLPLSVARSRPTPCSPRCCTEGAKHLRPSTEQLVLNDPLSQYFDNIYNDIPSSDCA